MGIVRHVVFSGVAIVTLNISPAVSKTKWVMGRSNAPGCALISDTTTVVGFIRNFEKEMAKCIQVANRCTFDISFKVLVSEQCKKFTPQSAQVERDKTGKICASKETQGIELEGIMLPEDKSHASTLGVGWCSKHAHEHVDGCYE